MTLPDIEGAAAERRYETGHVHPDGDHDAAGLVATAADLGYDGLVVRNHGDATATVDVAALADRHGIDVVDGVEIRAADRSRAAGFLTDHRSRRTIVCVHGGTAEIDRFAVEQDRVDVLAHPDLEALDHVLVRTAARHGVRIEASLAPIVRGDGGRRVRAIRGLRRLHRLVEKYDADHVVSVDPTSRFELRGPRDLIAVGTTVGLPEPFVRTGLTEWSRLTDRNRDRRSERFIEPGVKRGRYQHETTR